MHQEAAPMHRQSLVDYGKSLVATEAPTPEPRGSEVLLRVSHCGVCHSDIHLQDGYFDLGGGQKLDVRGNRPLPFTLGHEIAGTVEAAGPDAKGVAPVKFYAAYLSRYKLQQYAEAGKMEQEYMKQIARLGAMPPRRIPYVYENEVF